MTDNKAWSVRLLFEPRDLWRGTYWNPLPGGGFEVYICWVWMFPVRVRYA